MDLEPLEPLRVLLHPHALIDLVTEDPGPVQSLLGVHKVGVILRSVLQQLLHEEGVLGHSLDGLEEVEGEGHALHLGVGLTLPQQIVKLGPHLHQLL